PRQVVDHAVVHVELALIGQHRQRGGGECLGVGGDGEQRVLVHRHLALEVARAVTTLKHDLAVLDDRHRHRRHLEALADVFDVGVEVAQLRGQAGRRVDAGCADGNRPCGGLSYGGLRVADRERRQRQRQRDSQSHIASGSRFVASSDKHRCPVSPATRSAEDTAARHNAAPRRSPEMPHDTALPGLAVIGGGPAGLMAAEVARAAGLEVDLYEAKGSVGRKFLIAGKGGLNLTHDESRPAFDARYRERHAEVAGWLDDFDAAALREWARGLGVETYVGTSGRVFPLDRKAAPLLRGWVRRLREDGVRFHVQHRWLGWSNEGAMRFSTPTGEQDVLSGATVLALGGASWPQLGSDGAWQPWLAARGIDVAPLVPANCGFDIGWSGHFAQRHAGAPL